MSDALLDPPQSRAPAAESCEDTAVGARQTSRPKCGACGLNPAYSCGWCTACYHRWYRAGRPKNGPPPPRGGPQWSTSLREECDWLVKGGTSIEETAARVGVTVATVRRYVAPPARPAECAADGCHDSVTRYRWCDTHADPRHVYLAARAEGLSRRAAAHRAGVAWRGTYRWEPGQPGMGRPRKRVDS